MAFRREYNKEYNREYSKECNKMCLEVYSLVQDGILEPEVGAKRVSMSLDDFADAMQKAGYKIPELV